MAWSDETYITLVVVVELAFMVALLGVLCRTKVVPIADAEGFLRQGLLTEGAGNESSGGKPKVYRGVIFVTIGVFAGYASLNLLQHHLMDVMKGNVLSAQADVTVWPTAELGEVADWELRFKHAATCNFIGNLVFRIAHNFFFACLVPRHRVYVSLFAMSAAVTALGLGVYAYSGTSLLWVGFAYFMGGMGVGTFESNLLSSIAPLGPDTKVWAIIGMPVGFVSISVIGFILRSPPPFGAGLNPGYLYLGVMIALVNGIGWWIFYIPTPEEEALPSSTQQIQEGPAAATGSLARFKQALASPQREEWLGLIKWNCIALMVDMYAVSFFTAIPFYVYNDDHCPSASGDAETCSMVSLVVGTGTTSLMDHDRFFAVFNMHSFLGDTIARKVAYCFEPRHPMIYVILIAAGAVISSLRVPLLLWPGIFLIFFGNGAIYATTTRHIDQHVPREYNLVALSIWLFIGDFGSVFGSNTWMTIQDSSVYCDGAPGSHGWPHICL